MSLHLHPPSQFNFDVVRRHGVRASGQLPWISRSAQMCQVLRSTGGLYCYLYRLAGPITTIAYPNHTNL